VEVTTRTTENTEDTEKRVTSKGDASIDARSAKRRLAMASKVEKRLAEMAPKWEVAERIGLTTRQLSDRIRYAKVKRGMVVREANGLVNLDDMEKVLKK